MIKRLFFGVFLLALGSVVHAQRYYPDGGRSRSFDRDYVDDQTYDDGFKKEHLFIGGNIALGYDGYTFNAGISPELGYSFARWLDGGVLVNLNYSSERPDYYFNDNQRYRSFNYGTGAFVRVYPLPFLYFTASPEYNWIKFTQTDFTVTPHPSQSITTSAASFLLGIGYGQRIVGRSSMHLALMIDVLHDRYSPYLDYNGRIIPVLKAGFDIYFKPKKQYGGSNENARL